MDTGRQQAVVDLSRARRRNRLATVDWFDSFYQAYITGLGVAVVVIVASTFVPDQQVTPAVTANVAADGPALLGAVFAVVVALGLRSGGRGGPLALEPPTVQHVLLAPVDRATVLREPALKQLRFAAFTGATIGAVAGLLAARRLPVDPPVMVLCGAVAAALVAVTAVGAALVVSGHRMPKLVANLAAVAVVAAAGADLWAGTAWSPTSLFGRVALWGLDFAPVALLGAVVAVAVAGVGLAGVGGTSLEAARQRAGLVSELRFAVTLQDVRTVVLLRRRLAQEQPRSRPWLRLGALGSGRAPVWWRDWRGILRFPAVRLVRMAVLGAIAGACLDAVWAGTSTLVVVAGLALYIAALDAVETLAQEVDHPDRWASFAEAPGRILLRHLSAPSVLMAGVGVVTAATAALLGRSELVVPLAAVMLVPAAVAAVTGAAASTAMGTAEPKGGADMFPEAAGSSLIFRAVWPAGLVVLSLLPLLAARSAAADGLPPAPAAAGTILGPVLVTAGAMAWLWRRTPARL